MNYLDFYYKALMVLDNIKRVELNNSYFQTNCLGGINSNNVTNFTLTGINISNTGSDCNMFNLNDTDNLILNDIVIENITTNDVVFNVGNSNNLELNNLKAKSNRGKLFDISQNQ